MWKRRSSEPQPTSTSPVAGGGAAALGSCAGGCCAAFARSGRERSGARPPRSRALVLVLVAPQSGAAPRSSCFERVRPDTDGASDSALRFARRCVVSDMLADGFRTGVTA